MKQAKRKGNVKTLKIKNYEKNNKSFKKKWNKYLTSFCLSNLFPARAIAVSGDARRRASLSQEETWLKLSLLVMSKTSKTPAAAR